MKQRELIDYCNTRDDSGVAFGFRDSPCKSCEHPKECYAYFCKYGNPPSCDDFFHPERYTNEEVIVNE